MRFDFINENELNFFLICNLHFVNSIEFVVWFFIRTICFSAPQACCYIRYSFVLPSLSMAITYLLLTMSSYLGFLKVSFFFSRKFKFNVSLQLTEHLFNLVDFRNELNRIIFCPHLWCILVNSVQTESCMFSCFQLNFDLKFNCLSLLRRNAHQIKQTKQQIKLSTVVDKPALQASRVIICFSWKVSK